MPDANQWCCWYKTRTKQIGRIVTFGPDCSTRLQVIQPARFLHPIFGGISQQDICILFSGVLAHLTPVHTEEDKFALEIWEIRYRIFPAVSRLSTSFKFTEKMGFNLQPEYTRFKIQNLHSYNGGLDIQQGKQGTYLMCRDSKGCFGWISAAW